MSTALTSVSNDAKRIIDTDSPYRAKVVIVGTAPLLFHRWSVDAVEARAKASKGSKAKKEDDLESYVYRSDEGLLALPVEYFRMALIHAAKFKQDPRSPRKSAMDLFKAGIIGVDDLCSLGQEKWDFVDRRRVTVQRNAVTRSRPGLLKGWQAAFELEVLLPEYISSELLNDTIQAAGRLVGVGDFRPTFGMFIAT